MMYTRNQGLGRAAQLETRCSRSCKQMCVLLTDLACLQKKVAFTLRRTTLGVDSALVPARGLSTSTGMRCAFA